MLIQKSSKSKPVSKEKVIDFDSEVIKVETCFQRETAIDVDPEIVKVETCFQRETTIDVHPEVAKVYLLNTIFFLLN